MGDLEEQIDFLFEQAVGALQGGGLFAAEEVVAGDVSSTRGLTPVIPFGLQGTPPASAPAQLFWGVPVWASNPKP